MLKGIDHIVVVVRDLAKAVESFRRAGFTVTPGGEHVGGMTHNALIAFADGSYFEIIAFREPDLPQEHRWWGRLARGEGLVDYALLSDNLAADAERARAAGLPIRGPTEGGRLRPDGQELIWRSFFLGSGVGKTALPFVIEDVTPRDRRVPGGEAARHRLAVSGVVGLSLAVNDLSAAARALQSLLEAPGQPGVVPGVGRTHRFTIGKQWLELIEPTDPASAAAEQLRRLGEGPYEVTLSGPGTAEPGAGTLLTGELPGTRLRIVSGAAEAT